VNCVKSVLIAYFILLPVLAFDLEQAQSIELEKLSRAIVRISSGNNVRTGTVVKTRGKHNEALILTTNSNIENSGIIEIEFPAISEKKWEGYLEARDRDRDVALLRIKNPPPDIPNICFADANKLEEVDEVYCFEYGEEGELNSSQVHIKEFSGADIILSVPLNEKAYGGPVLETDKGELVGMVQKERDNHQVCDRVLRSGVLSKILGGWDVPTCVRKLKPRKPASPPVLSLSLGPRFGLVCGTILPFSSEWGWKLERGISLRLTVELAKEGELGTHRFGIIYSEFSSKPERHNPMGKLRSIFIFPVYSYWKTLLSTSISETRSRRLGVEATLGFGLGRHSLENGEFPADTLFADFVPHPGMKDSHLELSAYIMGIAVAYFFTDYSALHLGCDVYHFSMPNHTNYYYSFYIGANFRVSP